jgi:hypothetical protein
MSSLLNNSETIDKLYLDGYYQLVRGITSNLDTNVMSSNISIISLIVGNQLDTNVYDRLTQSGDINQLNTPEKNILYGLWNLSLINSVNNTGSGGNSLFTGNPDVNSGLIGLKQVDNAHSNYILFNYYKSLSDANSRAMAHQYLLAACNKHSADANDLLRLVGLNPDNTDQFFDHCKIWCGNDSLLPRCGCGSDSSNWAYGTCCLCGCRTSLDCADMAQYSSSGFLSFLQAIYQPLKLAACVSSIVALGLQQSNSPHVNIAMFLSTGFTTLVTFINKSSAT